MERTQFHDLMGALKLYGMLSAYDEVIGNGIKRQYRMPMRSRGAVRSRGAINW